MTPGDTYIFENHPQGLHTKYWAGQRTKELEIVETSPKSLETPIISANMCKKTATW